MNKLLAVDFGIWPAPMEAHVPGQNILNGIDYWGRLVDYLLLYDQIIIPTCDLQIVYILRIMLGDAVFETLIRNKVIVLARFNAWYGYLDTGKAGEIQFITKYIPSDTQKSKLLLSPFDPLEDVIEKALLLPTNPSTTRERRYALKNILIDNIEVLPSLSLLESARKEAQLDFEESPILLTYYNLKKNPFINKSYVAENTTSIKIYKAHNAIKAKSRVNFKSREITAALRIVFENFQLRIGNYLNATTLVGDDSSISVLKTKGQRFGFVNSRKSAFIIMKDLHNIPDISESFYSKRISPNAILELRNSDEGVYFREWLSKGSVSEHDKEILERYCIAIQEKHILEKFPFKQIRFVGTQIVDYVAPTGGLLADVINEHLVDWFKNKSPQLFLQKIKIVSDK